MNDDPNEKKEIATEMIKAILEKLDQSIEAQTKIADALHRLADTGEDAVSIALRYDDIILSLIERYSQKASIGANKTIIPVLKEVSEIISRFKSLGEEIS